MADAAAAAPPPPNAVDAQQMALMRAATAAHQASDFARAEAAYRAVLALQPHPGAAILLANVLLSRATAQEPALPLAERCALRASSLPLARSCLHRIDERSAAQRVRLWTRFAYYLLAFNGLLKVEGCIRGAAAAAVLPPDPARAALLAEATEALQRVVALDAGYTLAWRNLSLALSAANRRPEAEAAMRAAVDSVRGGAAAAPWELLYKHGKCLKRVGREADALARYCDAVEASRGAEELPLFWLRVALAEGAQQQQQPSQPPRAGGAPLPAACLARCRALLERFGGGAGGANGLAAPPDSYIRKLFDGYSANFDAHLVGVLGYKTPASMRALALATFCGQSAPPPPPWRQCADLGCGTGLAGVAFAGLVAGALDGCDLSPGMVAEAEKRALYRELAAREVVGWLRAQSARGVFYDLLLSADVLVYIGPLEALFAAAAESLRGAAAAAAAPATAAAAGGAAPPAFLFSTEAMLAEGGEGGEGGAGGDATFALTATGRCTHAAGYIRRLAREAGMRVAAHTREAIRENAGLPVLGDLWALALE